MSEKIGIQGLEGSYTHAAAIDMHGEQTFRHYSKFSQAFEGLRTQQVDRIVVAIANSRLGVTGAFPEFLDPSMRGEYFTDTETVLPIEHCLIGTCTASISKIRSIKSQKEALDQCGEFLTGLNGQISVLRGDDTALSAKEVSDKQDPSFAAIASSVTTLVYPDLRVIKTGVQDDALNLTRFLSIIRRDDIKSYDVEPNTTLGILRLSQKEGSLKEALSAFAEQSIALGAINSIPIPNSPLEVEMYIQIEAGYNDPRMDAVCSSLLEQMTTLEVLGTYKAHALDFEHVRVWRDEALLRTIDENEERNKRQNIINSMMGRR